MSFFATCVYLRRNLRAVWPPNASLYASSTCVHLRLLASPFGQGFKITQDYILSPGQTATQAEDLGQLATSFGQGLSALALTCDDLRSLWSRSNLLTQVDASFSPFGHPTQVNASSVTSINLLLANEIEDSLP